MNNIQEIFPDELKILIKKEYINNDNSIKSKALVKNWVYKRFPLFKELLIKYFSEDYFREVIYCILNDVEEIPICKNPNCNNLTYLRNFTVGFQKCCCKKCVSEYQHLDKIHAEKSKLGIIKHYSKIDKVDKYTQDLNCDYSVLNYYIFKNYCKHGTVKLYKTVSNRIHKIGQCTYCKECNKEIFNTYIPTENEINEFQNIFPDFYKKYSHSMKYEWWITYFPKYFKILIVYFEKYIRKYDNNVRLLEVYYVFLHKIKKQPTCCKCDKIMDFLDSTIGYRHFCEEHLYGFNKSYQEIELGNYIDTLNVNVIKNTRDIINSELDFYFPDKNLAIEYNGCWWHSDKFKEKDYHYKKWKQCYDKGIQLIFIWEDDWLYKTDIIKSVIKSFLGIYNVTINADDTEIKEVSFIEAINFINSNNLYGYSTDKIRLGLYYNNELVSIMSFAKTRYRKNNINNKNNNIIELLRYCNKNGYNIINGETKLFNYFINNYKFDNIICHVECDTFNKNIYDNLNMNYVSHIDKMYLSYRGIRYDRLYKFDKSISNNEIVKCYSSGLLKFEYTK